MTNSSRSRTSTAKPGKNARSRPTNAGRPPTNAGRPPTNAGTPTANAGARRKNAGEPEPVAAASSVRAPKFTPVALVAPARTGRAVENLELVVKNAEVRLKLAHLHRDALDPALPKSPSFHDHAWTALSKFRRDGAAAAAPPTDAVVPPLDALVAKLGVLRNIVEFTTRPGDPAREALGFGNHLQPVHSLPDDAVDMIAGARAHRARFPALTDRVLDAAEIARAAAAEYVERARGQDVDTTVERADTADARQLALDVLLDSIDHLRAAARAELSDSRPRLAEYLTAPLESARPRARDDKENPPTPPA